MQDTIGRKDSYTEFYRCQCGEIIEVFPYTQEHEMYCSGCGRTGCATHIDEDYDEKIQENE